MLFAHRLPEMFHRIELGTVRRKKDEADVVRHLQFVPPRFVSGSAVQDEAEKLLRMSLRQFFQETLMHRRMHAGKNERIHGAVERTESGEGVGVFSDGLLRDIRPHMLWRPAIRRTGDASESRFILKENAERQPFELRFKLCPLEDLGEKTL